MQTKTGKNINKFEKIKSSVTYLYAHTLLRLWQKTITQTNKEILTKKILLIEQNKQKKRRARERVGKVIGNSN